MLAGVPALRGQVRFVSMSFDPEFDTPAMMRSYGGADASAAAAPPWFFLTTAAAADLAPILDGFGQDVAVSARGAAGQRANRAADHRPVRRSALRTGRPPGLWLPARAGGNG